MALSNRDRCVYGALGAVAPMVAAGVSLNGHALQNFFADQMNVIAFTFSTICLLVIGAFVSFLHKKTSDEWTAFIIGISGPALVVTLVSNGGQRITDRIAFHSDQTTRYAENYQPLFISTAEASEARAGVSPESNIPFYSLCMPRRSTVVRFVSGMFGNFAQPVDLYWLASAAIKDKQTAVNAYNAYLPRAKEEGMAPRIFSITSGGAEQYVLVLNLNLSARAADAADPRLWRVANAPAGVAPISMNSLLERLNVAPGSLEVCHFQNDPPRTAR